MARGTVKSFNTRRHFGFIRLESSETDVFFHFADLKKSGLNGVRKGQRVEFDCSTRDGKMVAQNVRPAHVDVAVEKRSKQAPATHATTLKKDFDVGPPKRKRIAETALRKVIAESVRTGGPLYENFIDVYIERVEPHLPHDPNWTIRGVKFGRADRERCSEAVAIIVDQLQRDYEVSD